MSARALPLALSLLLVSAGCLHHTAPRATPCPAAGEVRSEPAAASLAPLGRASEEPTRPPRELVWKLRTSDKSAWTDLPVALHTFSIGRWECALSDVQADDAQLARTRRLACTHSTGATVQTQLSCSLNLEPSAGPAPSHPMRELELSLDSAGPLRLACEAR